MRSCERLRLTDDQTVDLTDFSERLAGAVAHLRDAWDIADPSNSRAIEDAVALLLVHAHSCVENPELFRGVLGSVKLVIAVQAAIDRLDSRA